MSGDGGRVSFEEDFKRFFVRGLVAILPTLVTFYLLVWAWGFLWTNLGRHLLAGVSYLYWLVSQPAGPWLPRFYLQTVLQERLPFWMVQAIGVALAVLAIYLVGLVAGNLIGRTFYRIAENFLLKIPFVRAVYPTVKQVTDFLLAERRSQFAGSRVVAVRPHAGNIWSIGLYTGAPIRGLSAALGSDMVTVFVPSSPTAFSGYVVVVPRNDIVELPLTVEEAMRLLLSGGVVDVGRAGGESIAVGRAGGSAPPGALGGRDASGSPGPAGAPVVAGGDGRGPAAAATAEARPLNVSAGPAAGPPAPSAAATPPESPTGRDSRT